MLPTEAELDKKTPSVVPRLALWPSLVLGVLAFGLDRGHKLIQLDILGWRDLCPPPLTTLACPRVEVLPIFDYMLVWNTGVSYGLMSSVPTPLLLFIVAAAMLLLTWWWWRTHSALTRFGLALCLGGALSNAVDRAIYGAVADFFHFHLDSWSFYIFNLADTAITVGVVLLVLDALRPVAKGG